MENKVLGDTLRLIQETQLLRDIDRLENTRMTLLEEDALRRAMGEPGLPTRRQDAVPREPQIQSATPENPGRKGALDDVLAWAKQQSSTLPGRRRRRSKRGPSKIAEHSTLDEALHTST